jgi:hypothetical protein
MVLILVLAVAVGLIITEPKWLPLVVPTDPYSSTPAANFASGSEGIVLPQIVPVPGMTAEQINAALIQVKHALEASHLDPRMWRGDPAPLLDLLAPDSASVVAGRLDSGDYGPTLIRLAPGSTLAATPRVDGEMTYSRVDWRGTPALSVVTNYVWAYAFREPPGVVVVHSETTWMFPLVDDLRPTSRGMYLDRTIGYWHGMDCAAAAKGYTAPPSGGIDHQANPGYSENDPLDAYYDPSRPLRVESGCRAGG